jgi:acyl carrier protein
MRVKSHTYTLFLTKYPLPLLRKNGEKLPFRTIAFGRGRVHFDADLPRAISQVEEADVQSSLGLAGDLDDVELVEDIEEAFGLRFADDDLKRCRTVGDLFALVERELPSDGSSCATAMCFYRMRRALEPLIGVELRPASPMEQLSGISIRRLYDVIRRECGLRPPPAIISVWGCIALLLVPLLPLTVIGLGLPWWVAPIAALPAIALYAVSPIRLSKEFVTFGDLVRKVSARSIGSLAHEGARLRSAEAWAALKVILSDHTALAVDAINPDTLILVPSKLSAQT